MVRPVNVALVTLSLTLPVGGYVVLHNRRLERRLPIVKKDELPDTIKKSLQIPGSPALNYVEGWYADIPARRFDTGCKNKIEDFARVFWTTRPMMMEWKVMRLLDTLGINPFQSRVNPDARNQPEFTKGKSMMNGLFVVEKGVEESNPNEILFSYWAKKTDGPLLGGVHQLTCEKISDRTIRVWFVSHVALNSTSAELRGEDVPVTKWNNWFGYDPKIVDPAANSDEPFGRKAFSIMLWMHRFYSKILLDFAVRGITQRK